MNFSKDSAARSSRRTSTGTYQLADPVMTPEEVLFSRKNAPQRYAEKDIYFAHELLPHGGRDVLPDSDTIKAVHSYASHFYEALSRRHNSLGRGTTSHVDERSMDETALLAFGILLEEAARESLGKNGDLVFTEGLEAGDEDDGQNLRQRGASVGLTSRGSQTPVGFESEDGFWRRKYSKRRKTQHDQD